MEQAYTYWRPRSLPALRLAGACMLLGGGLALVSALHPWIAGSATAHVLLAVIVLLVVWREIFAARADAVSRLVSLGRHHWRVVYAGGGAIDCHLLRIWRGPAWITLRLCDSVTGARVTVTLWRFAVSASAWRRLCVVTAR